ncbi:activator of Hsp90 ATPase-like protein [Chitinophaga dinghuensis]|uniref:Activator of Hsp90 ATPase-like protein n=1 Tax=Chitinophaga dinghuensis TaxID=1539050 RepID=A0A327VQF0_9BACT|nr:SRPBCC domain-containing protein [Chitinophaga dinghuensis]RAJ76664.1 activator of Hsp90 ATPase-like protein [Chitinophaga dinghuensis]
MADIKHKLVIKTSPDKVYSAITTQEGIESWWCKQTTAQPTVGFVNIFTFGQFRNEMKVAALSSNQMVKWECIQSIEEWVGTHVSFDLEEKNGNTVLRFTHGDWKAVTDTFAGCSYDWAIFMKSLKSFCESGAGDPR